MNIEYVKLSDGTIAVTNENGIMTKKDNNISSNELLIENKIEVVDSNINQSKKKVKEYTELVILVKRMLVVQPILFVAAILLGYIFKNIGGVITCFNSGSLVFGLATVMWGITYPIAKRKLKGYEGKLEKAQELKLEYERKLDEEKKELVLQKTPTINEPISLVQQNEFELSLIDEQLEKAYLYAIHSKPKKLILKRKPSKKR